MTPNCFLGPPRRYCPGCEAEVFPPEGAAPIPSKATLIVCPASICQQWSAELETHPAPPKFEIVARRHTAEMWAPLLPPHDLAGTPS